MGLQEEINEIIHTLREKRLHAKSETELIGMLQSISAFRVTGSGGQREDTVAGWATAVENQLSHIRSSRLTSQSELLTQKVVDLSGVADRQKVAAETLNKQTDVLIHESITLRILTRRLVYFTVALLVLTIGILLFTIYLYKDTHAEAQRNGATPPQKTEHP